MGISFQTITFYQPLAAWSSEGWNGGLLGLFGPVQFWGLLASGTWSIRDSWPQEYYNYFTSRLRHGLLKASEVMFLGTFIPLSILGHLSYLGTPHNWGPLIPGDPSYLGTSRPLIPAEILEFPYYQTFQSFKNFQNFPRFQNFKVFQIFRLLLKFIKLQKVLALFMFLLDFLVFVPLPSISLQAQELLGCGW